MTDTPYTVRDGVYRPTYGGRGWLAASLPGGAAFGCDRTPCLVVTGDLAAARARLAPVAHIDSGYVSALDLLADALLAIIDLDGCRGDCGDQTGACVPARIRAYLGWETTHE